MVEIEMETHFLCPISMQLMRDPVIVASGITYDRESIEKWFYSFHNVTCPVTKKDLSGTDLTPNHTLRRLIQAWCIINSGNGIDPIPTPSPPVSKTQIIKIFNESKKSAKVLIKCLQKLKSISQASRSNKKCLVDAGGVEFLASVLKNNATDSDQIADLKTAKDDALYILCHLQLSEVDLKKLTDKDEGIFMESLIQILKCGEFESRAYAIALLRSVYSVADPMHLIRANPEIFIQIVHILRNQITEQRHFRKLTSLQDEVSLRKCPSKKATKGALKLLLELCRRGKNRIKASNAGAVSALIELLLDESEKRVSEYILSSLDQLCRCAEGREEFIKHGVGLAIVSKKIFRVSCLASEKGVSILWYISKHSSNPRVLQEMMNVGVVSKLCLVIQSEINIGKIIERAKEILRLHSRVWKDSTCIPSNLSYYYPC